MSVPTHARNHGNLPLLLLSSTLALACGDSGGESATTGADDPSATGQASGSDTATTASPTGGGTDGPTTSATTPATTTGDDTSTSAGTTSAGTTSASDSETDATTGDEPIEPDPRQDLLELYAPRIWFAANEEYWPSTVDWAFPYQTRFVAGDNNYWLRSTDALDSPSDELPWFSGELDTAQVYGFYAEKMDGVLDLVYYVYYPYNRGKEVADTIWGNHVGDWEHITVRLLQNPDESYSPSQVYLSAHSFGGAYDWNGGEVELHDGTHPVVYAAWGSHGFWAAPGDHVYMEIGEEVFDVCVTLVCAELTDEASAGVAWDTWELVYGLDFGAQEGLEGASWPVWMSDAFTDPGAGDPSIPGMGPIYRWGNTEDCSVLGIPIDITDMIGVCRLEDGPTGPISKNTWGQELQ